MTGVTPSTISQVEKNLIYPSLPALFRIAESLTIEVATLFKDYGLEKNVYVYSGDKKSATSLDRIPENAAVAELLLPPDIDAPVEASIVRIKAGKKLSNHFFAHKGVEFGYLLSGRLEMTVANHSYEVNQGDTVYLQKEVPGKWQNTSESTAELLWFKFIG